MKQLLVILFIALVCTLFAASHSFSAQMHPDTAPVQESPDSGVRA